MIILSLALVVVIFFNDTATSEIYTLSLHDALPISCSSTHIPQFCPLLRGPGRIPQAGSRQVFRLPGYLTGAAVGQIGNLDRKSTRLNSSHSQISYAVFCLKEDVERCAVLFFSRLDQ